MYFLTLDGYWEAKMPQCPLIKMNKAKGEVQAEHRDK